MRTDLHFMLDLETMATTPDAAIVSIGCVRFDLYKGTLIDEFYRNITLQSNKDYYRVIDPNTVEWWLQQSKEAQDGLFEGARMDLGEALRSLQAWMCKEAGEPVNAAGGLEHLKKNGRIWSNGPTFDEVIIRDALTNILAEDFVIPFRGSRCVRTIIEIAKTMGLRKPVRGGTHHNALADARYQARGVIAVFKELNLS